jgi:hypothetical protein
VLSHNTLFSSRGLRRAKDMDKDAGRDEVRRKRKS